MKKIIYYLLCIIGAIGMAACDDSNADYVAANTLEITESVVDFQAVGGNGSITLGDGITEVEAESNVDWCNITGTSDAVISYTVLPNNDMQTRTATISITTSQAKGQITVTQSGFIVNFDLGELYSYADNMEFTRRIEFSSDQPVSAKVEGDAVNWLGCEKTAGGYMVSAQENTSGAARLGKITIQVGKIVRTYAFLQYGISDLTKKWNAAFNTVSGEKGADVFTISTNGDNEFSISVKELGYKDIKANYVDGGIKIPCGQYLGVERNFELYLGVFGAAGGSGIEPGTTYQLKPCLLANGSWGLAHVDDGSYKEPISALAVWALENKEVAGYWDLFYDLTLSL